MAATAGTIAPTVALLFPVLLGFAGLGMDAGYWMMQKRDLQTATDAAALAAGYDIANSLLEGEAESTALEEAIDNGYVDGAGGSFDVIFSEDGDGNRLVRVNITQEVSSFFSTMFLDHAVAAGTTAQARVNDSSSPYCILSLSPDEDQAISTSGSVTINASGCGITANSNSDTAIYLNGSVLVNVSDVHMVGNYDVVGSAEFNYNSMRTHGTATNDPYADFEMEEEPVACDYNSLHISSDATLNPGVYCGGLTITGNNDIVLNPGTYIMDGGDFDVSGGGSITGEDVTIVLTNSGLKAGGKYGNFEVSGSKTVELHAPTSGYYEGMVIYQDSNAPPSVQGNVLTGTSAITLDGVAYMPTRSFDFGGNGGVDSANSCSKIIALTVQFHGTPDFGSNCVGGGPGRTIGAPSVELIE